MKHKSLDHSYVQDTNFQCPSAGLLYLHGMHKAYHNRYFRIKNTLYMAPFNSHTLLKVPLPDAFLWLRSNLK